MAFGNLKKEYDEFRYEMRSLPKTNSMRKTIKKRMSDFLESVEERYGQDIVDILVKHPRIANRTQQENFSVIKEAGLLWP